MSRAAGPDSHASGHDLAINRADHAAVECSDLCHSLTTQGNLEPVNNSTARPMACGVDNGKDSHSARSTNITRLTLAGVRTGLPEKCLVIMEDLQFMTVHSHTVVPGTASSV